MSKPVDTRKLGLQIQAEDHAFRRTMQRSKERAPVQARNISDLVSRGRSQVRRVSGRR